MRKAISVFLLVLTASVAFAGALRPWQESQVLTRAAPTLSTEGMPLSDVDGYRVIICAEAGQTLSGGGAVRTYYRSESLGWMRNPSLDVQLGNAAGRQCFPSEDFRTTVKSGRVLYAADAVTVSGGTAVTVRIEGWQR